MIIETDRLILKHISNNDFESLKSLLQDKIVMYAYEHAFSNDEVKKWYDINVERYKNKGYGMLGIFLKENNIFIGQAGITKQTVRNKIVDEIGYILRKEYWHRGYAIESAINLKNYAFNILKLDKVYSIIRDNNIPSINVAKRNGMTCIDTIVKYYYNIYMPHFVYCIENTQSI